MTISPSLKPTTDSLYDTDYVQWVETTLQKLQQKDYANVDWENLLDEIGDMSRSERRSIESNMIVLILHLLKWQYQPDRRSRSWQSSVVEHRRRVNKSLKESPSLKPFLRKELVEIYADAVDQAVAETGLLVETFPAECPYAIAQILERGFLPE